MPAPSAPRKMKKNILYFCFRPSDIDPSDAKDSSSLALLSKDHKKNDRRRNNNNTNNYPKRPISQKIRVSDRMHDSGHHHHHHHHDKVRAAKGIEAGHNNSSKNKIPIRSNSLDLAKNQDLMMMAKKPCWCANINPGLYVVMLVLFFIVVVEGIVKAILLTVPSLYYLFGGMSEIPRNEDTGMKAAGRSHPTFDIENKF